MAEKQVGAFGKRVAVGFIVVAVVSWVALGTVIKNSDSGSPAPQPVAVASAAPTVASAAPTPTLVLPAQRLDADSVLGKSSSQVRAALGQPSNTTTIPERAEFFRRGGIDFWVTYFNGKAVEVGVGPQVEVTDSNKSQVFAWMGFQKDSVAAGAVQIAGTTYRLDASRSSVVVTEASFLAQRVQKEAQRTAKAAAARQVEARRSLAATIEHSFWQKGMEARVSARDRDGTTLLIQWELCGHATLTQLMEGSEDAENDMEHAVFQDALRLAGFKVVKCIDPDTGGGVGQKL